MDTLRMKTDQDWEARARELVAHVRVAYAPRVRRDGECWRIAGKKPNSRHGYVVLSFRRRPVRAHRAFYMMARGVISSAELLDHLCRNRWCVNPDHLDVVDNRTNVLRGIGVTAENSRKASCPQGHDYSDANTLRRRGRRHCLECERARGRRYWASGRGAAAQKIRRAR